MTDFLLYGCGSCENHGCEAIVRGTADILGSEFSDCSIVLSKQEYTLGIDGELNLPVERFILQKKMSKLSPAFIMSGISYILTKKLSVYHNRLYKDFNEYIDKNKPVALSVGGDNYCYGQHGSLIYLDKRLRENGCKKVLWGCSIEPNSLSDKSLIDDLDDFDLIVAREPVTANALKENLKRAKIVMYPDPAFALKSSPVSLPKEFKDKHIVGVNVSPTVSNIVNGADITLANYENMIEYIIQNTQYSVMLIPHVVWQKSNDLVPLGQLYEKFRSTGRVLLINEFKDCTELKGYIAKCDMFIGARTHSTIAAYSSCVPCVVVGYSVKADGIATQLFGTTDKYVVASQQLTDDDVLTQSFIWLDKNKEQIKEKLQKIMPDYIASAYKAAKEIREII
ncbi:MAG: polysaccharide pyruvyl transferase family protein [Acutalibacteraceae bacterium]